VDDGLRPAFAAVIAGELAERSLFRDLAGMQQALDDKLGIGRNRQAHALGLGEFDWPAHHAAGDIEFGLTDAEHLRTQHEQDRVDTVGGDDLARLAARPPGVAVEAAMLAGRAVKADAAWTVQHLPVDANIDAAAVGMSGQRDVAGADIAPAVAWPELRRRKLGEIDLVVAKDNFVDAGLRLRHV